MSSSAIKARALRAEAAILIEKADALDPAPELITDVHLGQVVVAVEGELSILSPARWLELRELREALGRPLQASDLAGFGCTDGGDDRDA